MESLPDDIFLPIVKKIAAYGIKTLSDLGQPPYVIEN